LFFKGWREDARAGNQAGPGVLITVQEFRTNFILMSNLSSKIPLKSLYVLTIAVALVWAGCGGKKSTPATGVTITITPTTASVAGGATQSFSATVTGSTNTAVTWQVNGEAGGDAVIGTISSTGVYTAPTVLPTTTTVTVTAVSQADTTKTASATVTLTAPAVTITINPMSATLAAGATQQFTPTISVTGSTNNAVTWSVNNVVGGDAIHGTIDTNGLYTAPLSQPQAGITVKATSQANTTFSASAPVTVQPGVASLNGTYVFLAQRPDDSSGTGFAYRGGTLIADGKGAISGGFTDANSGSGVVSNAVTDGTYTVGTDGRGTINFNDTAGAHSLSFALTSNSRGQVIANDSGPVTSGFIRLQDSAAVSAGAGPAGNFVVGLAGDNTGPAVAVGQLVFAATAITGTEDVNTNGGIVQGTGLAGTVLTSTTTGRGTLQLGSSNYAFYIIDASTFLLVDIDAAGLKLAGTAYAQSGTFSAASLGSSAYLVSGHRSTDKKAYAQAGRFDTDGISKFSGGVFDINSSGTLTINTPFASSAAYTINAANGRGTIATGTSTFIFWLASPKQGVIMQADASPSPVAGGLLFQQQTGISSITGGFAFGLAGADVTGATPLVTDGVLSIDTFGATSGTEDVNSGGTVQSGTAFTNSSILFSANQRGSGSVSGASFNFYLVSPDRFLMISSDPNTAVQSGIAERQCSDCQF